MPIDKETLRFLVEETVENGLEDCKNKLKSMAEKYKLKIIINEPKIKKVEKTHEGKVIWEK
ncbi:MAG: hypothetical protein U9O98_08375 [Asgard group archaeon]|nr:hypothetical protein [Asgard group archaeon]